MRNHVVFMSFALVLLSGFFFVVPLGAAAVSKVDTVAELKPLVFQFTPMEVGVETLAPGKYPVINIQWIGSGWEDVATCLQGISDQPREGFHVWQDLLDTGDIAIPEAYRVKGKVLVNWTTRILGEAPNIREDNPCYPNLEDSISLTLDISYKGGLAYSRIINVADGNKVLKELAMSIPDGGGEVIDPTHTGAVTLSSDMFPDGKLPAVIRLKVQWANDSSLRLTSTKAVLDETTGMLDQRMHNCIVTITRQ